MLVICDDKRIAAKHHTVAAAKSLWDVIGDVHLNLEGDVRLVGELHRQFSQVLHISFSRVEHFIIPHRICFQLF